MLKRGSGMKFLIVGLGSMGKRRIRNLRALEVGEIIGLDLKQERCKESEEKYSIKTFSDVCCIDIADVDAIIVSTPPDHHNEWIGYAISNKKPVFVEASVILGGLRDLNLKAKMSEVLVVPSSTLHFHPAIKIIREVVKNNQYGRVTNFSYHMGQYLPDWHPWEKIGDSYTGKKETSGAREMVAFEFTWLFDIVGFPRSITGFYGQTVDFGPEIDDTYAIALKFDKAFATLIVDTTSRYYIRHLVMNLERAQIVWNWDQKKVMLYEADKKAWQEILLPGGTAAEGYNQNILEDIYVDEMRAFIEAFNGESKFPNSLDSDIRVLGLLHKVEGELK